METEEVYDESLSTDEEVFNFVKNFLLSQNEKAKSMTDDCQYLGFKMSYIEEQEKLLLFDELGHYNNFITYDDRIDTVYNKIVHEFDGTNKPYYLRCAVGCLINLKYYDFDIEGKTIGDVEVLDLVAHSNPNLNLNHDSLITLLHLLQKIHDQFPTNSWKDTFDHFEGQFQNGKFMGDIKFLDGKYKSFSHGEITS